MKPKNRLNDANQQLCFDLKLPSTGETELGLRLFKEITRNSTVTEKCSVIEEVSKAISDGREEDMMVVTQLLFSTLLQLESKSLLRKNILQSLEKICERFSVGYYSSVHKIIRTALESPKYSTIILNELLLLVERKDLIVAASLEDQKYCLRFLEDICVYILKEAENHIQFIWLSATNSQTSTAETNSLFQVIHQIIKYLTTIYEENFKNFPESSIVELRDLILFENLLRIATAEVTPLDLRTSCGLLLIQIQIEMEDGFVAVFRKIFNKEHPFDSVGDMGLMALFHGLLCHAEGNMLFGKMLPTDSDDLDDVAAKMLKRIFHIINTAQISSVAILGSRILNHLMVKLLEHIAEDSIKKIVHQRYSVHSDNSKKIQDIIWLLWDHFLACVKHLSRESFILFIKVQNLINKDSACSYFRNLSFNLLNTFPNKRSYSIVVCLVPFVGVHPLLEAKKDLVKSLVLQLSDPSFSSQSANLLEALFITHKAEVEYNEWHQFWFGSFFDSFSKDALVYGFESVLEKLFMASQDMTKPIAMLSESINLTDNKLCLLIMSTKIYLKHLKTGNKVENNEANGRLWKDVLPFHHLAHALGSGDETLCILAFSLVSESKKSTELLDQRELEAIMHVLEYNIVSQNASFRQKLVNNVKKIINRIHKGLNSKSKGLSFASDVSEFSRIQKIHEEFIRKLFKFLENNLFSGSNFPRRSSSLLMLELLLGLLEKGSPFSYLKSEFLSHAYSHTLLLCLNDSYEANKQIALNILLWINNNNNKPQTNDIRANEVLLESIWLLASSSKASDSLTASYIFSYVVNNSLTFILDENIPVSIFENKRLAFCWAVLMKIRSELQVAQVSLLKASSSGPMYGLLLCLRRLFADLKPEDLVKYKSHWSELVKDTIRTCYLIVDVVSDVVKNSSPEGHLPMDYTSSSEILKETVSNSIAAQEHRFNEARTEYSKCELVKAQAVSSQMLLICGWRSVKEVALLFGLLIQGSSSVPDILNFLSVKDVKAIGNFYIVQLTETKHRGAFEQAYSGFEMVCNRLWQCSDKEMNKLPESWLKNILDIIQDENDSKLCATRRSAGVPFIIQAIVSSEPSIRGGSCLKTTMDLLLQLACSETKLETRIHALNILRALYKDTRLGEVIVPYVSVGVQIAVNGYESKSWSVRNSSSLMFAAIVTRMLGVKKTRDDFHSKNAVSALVFFRRYPDLYDFFLEKMRMSVFGMKEGDISVSIFPTILILARLAPASSDGYSTSIPLTPFVPYVLELLGSPVYKVRTLASRALIPLVSPLTLINTVEHLCSSLCLKNQNLLHGSLLGLGQMLKSFSNVITSSADIRTKLTELFSSSMWVSYESNPCCYSRSCAIELFKYIVNENLFPSLNLKSLTTSCFSLLLNSPKRVYTPGGDLIVKAAADFFLTVNKKHNKENVEPFVQLLNFSIIDIRLVVLNHCSAMETLSRPLIQKLLAGVQLQDNPECWRLAAHLLSRIIITFEQEEWSIYAVKLDAVLCLLHQKLLLEQRDNILAAVIELSGKILRLKLKFVKKLESNFVLSWIDYMVKFSHSSYAPEIRVALAEAVGELLCALQEASKLEESAEVPLIEVLIESLVEDDEYVSAVACKYASLFLARISSQDQEFEDFLKDIARPISFVLEKILYYLASKGTDACFASILLFTLKEDLPQEFGLSQEEDRAFDKGETQILRENITLCKMASKGVERTREVKGDDFISSTNVRIENLTDQLLLPIPNSIKKNVCTVEEFLTVLKREIEYVLDNLCQLNKNSPFKMKDFELWLERSTRRAYVWNVLKDFASYEDRYFDNDLLANLECGFVRPSIFSSILECLS